MRKSLEICLALFLLLMFTACSAPAQLEADIPPQSLPLADTPPETAAPADADFYAKLADFLEENGCSEEEIAAITSTAAEVKEGSGAGAEAGGQNFEDPLPLGTTVTISDWEITVTSWEVTTIMSLERSVQRWIMDVHGNSIAEDSFILVFATAKNIGTTEQAFAANGKLWYQNRYEFSPKYDTLIGIKDPLSPPISGYIAFAVSEEVANSGELLFELSDFDDNKKESVTFVYLLN
jgi:hypothetical protein